MCDCECVTRHSLKRETGTEASREPENRTREAIKSERQKHSQVNTGSIPLFRSSHFVERNSWVRTRSKSLPSVAGPIESSARRNTPLTYKHNILNLHNSQTLATHGVASSKNTAVNCETKVVTEIKVTYRD